MNLHIFLHLPVSLNKKIIHETQKFYKSAPNDLQIIKKYKFIKNRARNGFQYPASQPAWIFERG